MRSLLQPHEFQFSPETELQPSDLTFPPESNIENDTGAWVDAHRDAIEDNDVNRE